MVDSSKNPGNNVVLFNILFYIEGAMEYLLCRALGLPWADTLGYFLVIRNIAGLGISVWLAYNGYLGALRKAIVVLAYILAVYYGIVNALYSKGMLG